jgi:hypothetical protein
MSIRKTKREQILKFPIFVKCKELEIVPFWKAFFDSCAYGQFPKGLILQGNTFSYKKSKKKAAITCFVPDDPVEALKVVKHFMRNEVGVISVDELTKQRVNMNIAIRKNVISPDTTWKEIRAPTTKHQMIVIYCFRIMESWNLTLAQTNNLFSTISVGLICGTLCSDDIILNGGTIVDIKGINHDDCGFFTEKTVQIPEIVMVKPERKIIQTRTISDWPKISQQYAAYIGVS